MIIHQAYPRDIPEACRQTVAERERNPDPDLSPQYRPRNVLAVIEILDLVEARDGPEKWVWLNHDITLSFFQFDPNKVTQQRPQVMIWCQKRVSRLEFLLPPENWPWEYAKTHSMDTHDAADLIIDAFARCESRLEHLVYSEPKA